MNNHQNTVFHQLGNFLKTPLALLGVDIFYANFSVKKQALINLIGFVLFVLPISLLIVYYGIDFTYQAFILNEQSGDPGGLTHRFIIKSIIPISFILVIISGALFAKDNYEALKQ